MSRKTSYVNPTLSPNCPPEPKVLEGRFSSHCPAAIFQDFRILAGVATGSLTKLPQFVLFRTAPITLHLIGYHRARDNDLDIHTSFSCRHERLNRQVNARVTVFSLHRGDQRAAATFRSQVRPTQDSPRPSRPLGAPSGRDAPGEDVPRADSRRSSRKNSATMSAPRRVTRKPSRPPVRSAITRFGY